MPIHLRSTLAALAVSTLAACTSQPGVSPVAAPAAVAASSILQRSTPAAGATVVRPVNALILDFGPPARLNEVIVTGPDGAMPMMISAVGEQARYSVPLPALGPGAYSVSWRASVGAEEFRGDFAFTVK